MSASADRAESPVAFSSLVDTTEESLARYRGMPYEEFLKTDYWAAIRAHLITIVGKCQLCSSRTELMVHHNTYENHGREHLHLDDLTLLCERCHMYFHRIQQLPNSLPPLYERASFENFRLPVANPIAHREMAHVLLSLKQYVREFPKEGRPGLLLIGEPGTGKTHLAAAAFNELRSRGFLGLFYDYQTLAERLSSGARDRTGTAELEACRAANLLLLDDIGSQRPKDWMMDAVLSVIKHRCNERKPLIATTSLPDQHAAFNDRAPAGLAISYKIRLSEVIGSQARSRLYEMCRVVVMPAVADYRVEHAEVF